MVSPVAPRVSHRKLNMIRRRAAFLYRKLDSPNPVVYQAIRSKLRALKIPVSVARDERKLRSKISRLVLSKNTTTGPGKKGFQKSAFDLGFRRDKELNNYEWIGLSKPRPRPDPTMEFFSIVSDSIAWGGRFAALHWQIGEQTQYGYDNDLFCVFDTWTYSPRFAVDDNHVKETIASLKPLGLVGYCVVAEGNSKVREHYHAMLWFDDRLPQVYRSDPNNGRPGSRREIDMFKNHWQYGISAPIAFRVAAGDAWDQCGHVWPYVGNSSPPVLLGTVNPYPHSGGYLCKYLTKDHATPGRAMWVSRGLGCHLLRDMVAACPRWLRRPSTEFMHWAGTSPVWDPRAF